MLCSVCLVRTLFISSATVALSKNMNIDNGLISSYYYWRKKRREKARKRYSDRKSQGDIEMITYHIKWSNYSSFCRCLYDFTSHLFFSRPFLSSFFRTLFLSSLYPFEPSIAYRPLVGNEHLCALYEASLAHDISFRLRLFEYVICWFCIIRCWCRCCSAVIVVVVGYFNGLFTIDVISWAQMIIGHSNPI